MYEFTTAQQQKALFWLVLFHILIIAASNYLVQFPFQIFGIHTTWGAFSFPFIFLATDLTVRIFGSHLARRIIFWVMFPALLLSYIFSVLFHDGSWTGLGALSEFNTFVGRIALASFAAYALGQILDIFVFNKLRRLKAWWIAPTASTVIGNAHLHPLLPAGLRRDFEYLDEEADCTASCSPRQTDGFFTRKLKGTLKTAYPYQKKVV